MINIAEILKNKPVGTKLWSPLFGRCTLAEVAEARGDIIYPIIVTHHNDVASCFTKYGQYLSDFREGECLLFPSKYIRNWEKFSWKKGDVLTNKDNTKMCIFNGWYKDDYTQIKAKHWENSNYGREQYLEGNQPLTSLLHLASKDEAEIFISNLEERFEGKLNKETLEIEPIKQEHSFKPFEKVLVRDDDDLYWGINFFCYMDNNPDDGYRYVCLDATYRQCIPYEGNEHLLGTTNSST